MTEQTISRTMKHRSKRDIDTSQDTIQKKTNSPPFTPRPQQPNILAVGISPIDQTTETAASKTFLPTPHHPAQSFRPPVHHHHHHHSHHEVHRSTKKRSRGKGKWSISSDKISPLLQRQNRSQSITIKICGATITIRNHGDHTAAEDTGATAAAAAAAAAAVTISSYDDSTNNSIKEQPCDNDTNSSSVFEDTVSFLVDANETTNVVNNEHDEENDNDLVVDYKGGDDNSDEQDASRQQRNDSTEMAMSSSKSSDTAIFYRVLEETDDEGDAAAVTAAAAKHAHDNEKENQVPTDTSELIQSNSDRDCTPRSQTVVRQRTSIVVGALTMRTFFEEDLQRGINQCVMRWFYEHRKQFTQTLADTAPLELMYNVRRYSTTDNSEHYFYDKTQIVSVLELRILSRVIESKELVGEIERLLEEQFSAQEVERPYELIDQIVDSLFDYAQCRSYEARVVEYSRTSTPYFSGDTFRIPMNLSILYETPSTQMFTRWPLDVSFYRDRSILV